MSRDDAQQWRATLSVVANVASLASLALICIAVVLAVGASLGAGRTGAPPTATPTRADPVSSFRGTTHRTANAIVPAGAKVAVVEFSDYQCPFCERFARDVFPELESDFVESGRIAYVPRHFPLERLHPLAMGAALAVECAGQGHFWDMRQRLFADDSLLTAPNLAATAASLGVDAVGFATCLGSDQSVLSVKQDLAEGQRLGVRATPTFFVGTFGGDDVINITIRIVGAPTYASMRAIIERALNATASGKR